MNDNTGDLYVKSSHVHHEQYVRADIWHKLLRLFSTLSYEKLASRESVCGWTIAHLLDASRHLYNLLWTDFIELTHEAAELWDEVKSLRQQRAEVESTNGKLHRALGEEQRQHRGKCAELLRVERERDIFCINLSTMRAEKDRLQNECDNARAGYNELRTMYQQKCAELEKLRNTQLNHMDKVTLGNGYEGTVVATYRMSELPMVKALQQQVAKLQEQQQQQQFNAVTYAVDFSRGGDDTVVTVWRGGKVVHNINIADERRKHSERKTAARMWHWHHAHGYNAGKSAFTRTWTDYVAQTARVWPRRSTVIVDDFGAVEARVWAHQFMQHPQNLPKRHGKPWTATEDDTLRTRYLDNRPLDEIAVFHQREPEAILYRLAKLNRWGLHSKRNTKFLAEARNWFFAVPRGTVRSFRLSYCPLWARR